MQLIITACECQVDIVGKDRLVLDLSCRKRDGTFWVVTDRWQRFSQLAVNRETLQVWQVVLVGSIF